MSDIHDTGPLGRWIVAKDVRRLLATKRAQLFDPDQGLWGNPVADALLVFVDHGRAHQEHVARMIDLLLLLLKKQSAPTPALNDLEVYVLAVATILHDVGMYWGTTVGDPGAGDQARERHASLSRSRILDEHLANELPPNLQRLVATIAESHSGPDWKARLRHRVVGTWSAVGAEEFQIRPLLLGALLRLGDAMHMGASRVLTPDDKTAELESRIQEKERLIAALGDAARADQDLVLRYESELATLKKNLEVHHPRHKVIGDVVVCPDAFYVVPESGVTLDEQWAVEALDGAARDLQREVNDSAQLINSISEEPVLPIIVKTGEPTDWPRYDQELAEDPEGDEGMVSRAQDPALTQSVFQAVPDGIPYLTLASPRLLAADAIGADKIDGFSGWFAVIRPQAPSSSTPAPPGLGLPGDRDPMSLSSVFDQMIIQTPHFIGRDEELGRLERWLGDGSPIATVGAPSGTGKTWLAARFARTCLDNGRYVLWLSVKPGYSLNALMGSLAKEMDANGDSRATALVNEELAVDTRLDMAAGFMEDSKCLMILDDYHLVAASDIQSLVTTVDRKCQQARLLLVTRRDPSIADLPKMPTQKHEDIVLQALPVELARSYLASLGLMVDDAVATSVWEKCAGNAEAMRLIAGASRRRDLGILLEVPLSEGASSLMASIVADLNDAEIRAAKAVSILDGPVAEDLLVSMDVSRAAVDSLHTAYLVDIDVLSRIHLHAVVRDYCLSSLSDSESHDLHALAAGALEGNASDIQCRYAPSFEAWPAEDLRGWVSLQREAFDHRLKALETVWDDSVARDAMQRVEALPTLYGRWGDTQGIVDLDRASLPLARRLGDGRLIAFWQSSFAEGCRVEGDYVSAEVAIEEALQILNSLPDAGDALMQAKLISASNCIARGRHEEAASICEEVVRSEHAADSAKGRAFEIMQWAAEVAGDFDSAVQLARQALECFERAENQFGIADASTRLGAALANLRSYNEARELLERGISIAERLEYNVTLGCALQSLGFVMWNLGDLGVARGLYSRAHSVYDQLGQVAPKRDVLVALVGIARASGDAEEEETLLESKLCLDEVLDDCSTVLQTHARLATLTVEAGRDCDALDHCRNGLGILQRLLEANPDARVCTSSGGGHPLIYPPTSGVPGLSLAAGEIYFQLAQISSRSAISDQSWELLSCSVAWSRVADNTLSLALSLNNLGVAAMELGRLGDATDAYTESVTLISASDDSGFLWLPLANLAVLMNKLAKPAESERYIAQAFSAACQIDSPADRIGALLAIGDIATKARMLGPAAEAFGLALSHNDRAGGDVATKAAALCGLGLVEYRRGNHSVAERYYSEVNDMGVNAAHHRMSALSMLALLRVARKPYWVSRKAYREVEALYRELLEMKNPALAPHTRVPAQSMLGLCLMARREYADAETVLRDCIDTSRAHKIDTETRSALGILAAVLRKQRRYKEALSVLAEEQELWRTTGARQDVLLSESKAIYVRLLQNPLLYLVPCVVQFYLWVVPGLVWADACTIWNRWRRPR